MTKSVMDITLCPEEGRRVLDMLERASLCLPDLDAGIVLHQGDPGFQPEVRRHFGAAENDTGELLVSLKGRLRHASTADFWRGLMEGMTTITDSQFGFVTKRMLVDDPTAAVEMPPIGEPGSCLVAEAFYYNDGHGQSEFFRKWSYAAYGAPCGYMKHDKVLLIPERFDDFITTNPNTLPFPAEAYLAVPLFAEGKCIGHFGVMWTPEAAARRKLSWGYLEMLLHTLEDLILERLLAGQTFGPSSPAVETAERPSKVIPHEAIMASQSLKPYARSLSHELRTPMQGIVGMLDIMHATLQESTEIQTGAHLRKIFSSLRESIEVSQDSLKRAVEAADNVVHAYDLNMEVPLTPDLELHDLDTSDAVPRVQAEHASSDEGIGMDNTSSKKRRRSRSMGDDGRLSSKRRTVESVQEPLMADELINPTNGSEVQPRSQPPLHDLPSNTLLQPSTPARPHRMPMERPTTPGMRPTRLRHLLPVIVQDCLQNGGRPVCVTVVLTPLGEDIEAQCRMHQGDMKTKMVRWTVDPEVPSTIPVDERDFIKLVSCVLLNAIKFTEEGIITVTATLSHNRRYVVINVEDTGRGIPSTFQPELFKAFSREDDSLTRHKDGLGLGLLVAKGVARKIGGDVVCVRSHTTGPRHGSEFEIRMPMGGHHRGENGGGGGSSIPGSPLPGIRTRTPTPTPPISYSQPPPSFKQSERRSPAPTSNGHQHTPTNTDQIAPLNESEAHPPPIQPSLVSINSIPSPPPTLPRKASTFDRTLALKHPLTFLVVEDNHINRKLLINMLSKLGYRHIYEAYDGSEAVRQMSRDDLIPPVDVILMDLWMPCMDGFEAAKKILSMARYSRTGDDNASLVTNGHGDCQEPCGRIDNKEELSGRSGEKEELNGRIDKKEEELSERNENQEEEEDKIVILAVTADATDEASTKASEVGMKGLMTKPYKLVDLERAILEYCVKGKRRTDPA